MNLKELSNEDLLKLKVKTENEISKYHNFQLVRKIQLNSAYGAIGNQYFRFYSTELAEAITLSGQLIIQYIANQINSFLNDALGIVGKDFIVASDTDSVYINMEDIKNKFCKSKDKIDQINYIDNICNKILTPFIEKQFDRLAKSMNAFENRIKMEREVIADKGVWTAKKRYMLNVWDSEGIRYKEPKQKIMGIETTRSSTPEVVRDNLKKAIYIILNGSEKELVQFVESFKKEFFSYPPEKIAFPRSVNGLKKYYDRDQIYKKSTPIAVKGSLIHNHYLDKLNLTSKYNKIMEGEKIKFLYLKKPNPLAGFKGDDCVISFNKKLPKEFNVDKFVDYNMQFEKTFLDPLTIILNVIGWNHEEVGTLEELFI